MGWVLLTQLWQRCSPATAGPELTGRGHVPAVTRGPVLTASSRPLPVQVPSGVQPLRPGLSQELVSNDVCTAGPQVSWELRHLNGGLQGWWVKKPLPQLSDLVLVRPFLTPLSHPPLPPSHSLPPPHLSQGPIVRPSEDFCLKTQG